MSGKPRRKIADIPLPKHWTKEMKERLDKSIEDVKRYRRAVKAEKTL